MKSLALISFAFLVGSVGHAGIGNWFQDLCKVGMLNSGIQEKLASGHEALDPQTQAKVAQAVQAVLTGADFAEVPLSDRLNASWSGLLRELILWEESREECCAPDGFLKAGYYASSEQFVFMHRRNAPAQPRKTYFGKTLLALHGLAEEIAAAASSGDNGKFVAAGTEATVTRANRKVTEAAHRHEGKELEPGQQTIDVSVELFGTHGTVKGVPGEGDVVSSGVLLFMAGPGTGRPALHGSPPAAERFHALMVLDRVQE